MLFVLLETRECSTFHKQYYLDLVHAEHIVPENGFGFAAFHGLRAVASCSLDQPIKIRTVNIEMRLANKIQPLLP